MTYENSMNHLQSISVKNSVKKQQFAQFDFQVQAKSSFDTDAESSLRMWQNAS